MGRPKIVRCIVCSGITVSGTARHIYIYIIKYGMYIYIVCVYYVLIYISKHTKHIQFCF